MKICLVGSTRFKERYEELNRRLSVVGHVVYSVACTGQVTPNEKEMLDLVHLQKIVESEVVVIVTDESGYIGESTRREVLWAKMLGKKIYSSQFASHISHLVMQLPLYTFPVVKNED